MQNSNPPNPILNLLVLVALSGTVLFGWLAGHILRYSMPAFWHPPTRETNPHIKTGFEAELGSERSFHTLRANPWERVYIPGMQTAPPEACPGLTYYTSLPAKCQTVNGQLARVEGGPPGLTLTPGGN
jgi:hypothetical protein